MKLESIDRENDQEKLSTYNKALNFIKKMDINKIPQNIHTKLHILSRIFALGAVLAAPTAKAENSEQENLEQFLNSDSITHQELVSADLGAGFEEKNNINKEIKYLNEYDIELLTIDPTDILKDEWNYRDKPSADTKFEFNLNDGADFEDTYKQLQKDRESTEELEPIPLSNDSREIGELKSIYDTTLQVQRIYKLVESDQINSSDNPIFIQRTFNSEAQIVTAVNLSINHLVSELSQINNGLYQSQVEQITSNLSQIDQSDPDKLDKLVDIETQLIQLLNTEFGEQEKITSNPNS